MIEAYMLLPGPNTRDQVSVSIFQRIRKMNSSLATRVAPSNSPMLKTQGEMEAAVCEGMARFELEYMGRGPKDTYACLIGDLLLVRLMGVLTPAEQHLTQSANLVQGRALLKQVRTQLVEQARPKLDAMIHDITGCKPRSLHHDISTFTGEEIILFTLADVPNVRESRARKF